MGCTRHNTEGPLPVCPDCSEEQIAHWNHFVDICKEGERQDRIDNWLAILYVALCVGLLALSFFWG